MKGVWKMNDNAITLCQYINQYYWIKMNDDARALTNKNDVTRANICYDCITVKNK